MPKGKNKRKQRDRTQQEGGDIMSSAVASTASIEHDNESLCDSIPDSTCSDEIELYEESQQSFSESDISYQLSEHIDNLTDKSSRVRLTSLSYINNILKHRLVTGNLSGKIETITDNILRGLKKVNGIERQELLNMVSLLSIQFGDEYNDMYTSLYTVINPLIHDNSISILERSTALSTMTFCTFLLCQDFKQVELVMHECERIYCTSKIDVHIINTAIKGWTLLLSILPNHIIHTVLLSQLPQLSQLLESSTDLSLKISVGHSVSLLFELIRETNEELLEDESIDNIKSIVSGVASESNRYTGKKDRTTQRTSFRDISHSLETGYVPERNIKFGTELLCLDTWSRIVQYNAITDLLTTGCRYHLINNEIVREIFQLGLPVLVHQESKADKIERKLYNAASAKWRTQSRGKQRDKRSVI